MICHPGFTKIINVHEKQPYNFKSNKCILKLYENVFMTDDYEVNVLLYSLCLVEVYLKYM